MFCTRLIFSCALQMQLIMLSNWFNHLIMYHDQHIRALFHDQHIRGLFNDQHIRVSSLQKPQGSVCCPYFSHNLCVDLPSRSQAAHASRVVRSPITLLSSISLIIQQHRVNLIKTINQFKTKLTNNSIKLAIIYTKKGLSDM